MMQTWILMEKILNVSFATHLNHCIDITRTYIHVCQYTNFIFITDFETPSHEINAIIICKIFQVLTLIVDIIPVS